MTPKEKKEITKRLCKVDKKLWATLSEEERDRVIEKYNQFLDFRKFQLDHLLKDIWERSDSVFLIAAGIIFGISGNLFANMLDRVFGHYGTIYNVIVSGIFILSNT